MMIGEIIAVTDEVLLERIANNKDRQALTDLYDRYRHTLGGFLRRRLREQKLVDEVYNDVMFTVWNKAVNFRGDAKVSTWIFGIAHRVCLSQSRKESRHTDQIADYELNDLPDAVLSNEVAQSGLQDTLQAALMTLSDAHRNVIELAYYQGYSIADIATIIERPVNTVKTRLYHARLYLKDQIQNELNGNMNGA